MKPGEQIPSFKLPDQDWNDLSSESLLGEPFVIYFYPKDDTPGCTRQACAFRDHFEEFQDQHVRVIGISADTPEEHRRFKEKHNLPFTLLSDPEKKTHKLFNVGTNLFGLIPGRVTYVFDAEGKLVHTFSSQMHVERHVKESLEALSEMG